MIETPSDDIVFLVTTFTRAAKYIPAVTKLIDAHWPDHPLCYFLTDGGVQLTASFLVVRDADWVEMFLKGLGLLRERHPDAKYVFHMLEDHCPLQACDSARIRSIFSSAHRCEFNAVTFPTYQWPWHDTQDSVDADSLVIGWRRSYVRQVGDEKFAMVPRDFFRYF